MTVSCREFPGTPGGPGKSAFGFLLLDREAAVLIFAESRRLNNALSANPPDDNRSREGETVGEIRTKWLTSYSRHVEPASREIFSHVEKMIIGTLIVSAGAHVTTADPAIELFGHLRHSLVGRGVELFGVVLLVLNFLDGLHKLAKLEWHIAYQVVMTLCYVVLSVRLIQLILAFRGE